MTRLSFLLVALLANFALVLPGQAADEMAGEQAEMSPTAKVLNHHLEAFGSGDVEGIVSDYSEDSVILTQGGALKGLDAIRGAFTGMVAEFSKPGMTFEMLQMNIEGEVAFIIWKAETADNIYELGTDTFVIRDGVIVSQTLCVVAKPKEAMAE